MSNFIRQFDIRWSDLDPNRHVANTSYAEFMNETRMSFLTSHGLGQEFLEKHSFGPVIFSEEFHYIKEIMPGEKVFVDVELLGTTEDYRFMKFAHCLYNHKGILSVYSEVFFGWFDLKTRKLRVPPEEVITVTNGLAKAEGFKVFTKEELFSTKVPNKSIEV